MIKLKLDSKFGPFDTLDAPELPKLTVLTGKNGAGKSQLLRAIAEQKVKMDGMIEDSISYFNSESFQFKPSTMSFGLALNGASVNSIFDQKSRKSLIDIFEQLTTEAKTDLGSISFKNFFNKRGMVLGPEQLCVSQEIAVFMESFRKIYLDIHMGGSTISRDSQIAERSYKVISGALCTSGKLPHLLSSNDFQEYIDSSPVVYPLHNQIAGTYLDYLSKRARLTYDRAKHEDISIRRALLEFDELNSPPWVRANRLISEMRRGDDETFFQFSFRAPNPSEFDVTTNPSQSFSADILDIRTGEPRLVTEMSSGEIVLLTICLLQINCADKPTSTVTLLLDEVESVLHPSMLKSFFKILGELSAQDGFNVLVASHSPTTVALAPSDAVFELTKLNSTLRVRRTEKSSAIRSLTEGFMTFEDGVGLLTSIRQDGVVTILSEGNNSIILKRFVHIFYEGRAVVLEGLEKESGSTQLVSFARACGVLLRPPSKIIVVFDCDAKKDFDNCLENDCVMPLILDKNDCNEICKKGIENAFSDDLLRPFARVSSTRRASTNEVIRESSEYNADSKREFAEFISKSGEKEHFSGFSKLRKLLDEILDAQDL